MNTIKGQLIVYFESPYWVGVFERIEEGKLKNCRVIFGPEPKDYEVLDFVLKHYDRLSFGVAVEVNENLKRKVNPKRVSRLVRKEALSTGISTKSQEAMKLTYVLNKEQKKKTSKAIRIEYDRLKYEKSFRRKNKRKEIINHKSCL